MRLPQEVLVLVHRRAEVLVLHRAPDHDPYWHFVAGAFEPGETAAEAARRELREETGLDAEALVDLGHRYAYPLTEELPVQRELYDAGTRSIEVDSFAVEVPLGWEPELNEEHDGYRWCSVAEAHGILRWPEVADTLRLLEARLEEA